jgi:VanZ family protein
MRVYDTSTPVRADAWLRLAPLWNGIGALLIATIFYLSLTPDPVHIPVEEGDKLGHISAYAVLMLWYAQIHPARARRALLAAVFIGMGIAIEFLQRGTGYRSFEVGDMVADGVGVAVGWMLAPPRLPNALRVMERLLGRPLQL